MTQAITRLKMKVERIQESLDGNLNKVNEFIYLHAVYSDNPKSINKLWSKWTPAGSLQYNVSNPNAFDKIKVGDYFFVDLIPTTEEED